MGHFAAGHELHGLDMGILLAGNDNGQLLLFFLPLHKCIQREPGREGGREGGKEKTEMGEKRERGQLDIGHRRWYPESYLMGYLATVWLLGSIFLHSISLLIKI